MKNKFCAKTKLRLRKHNNVLRTHAHPTKYLLLFFGCLFAWTLCSISAQASTQIDQQQTGTTGRGYVDIEGQVFTPSANNINKITVKCCGAITATTTLNVCHGTPGYNGVINSWGCLGAGNSFVASTSTLINCAATCTGPSTDVDININGNLAPNSGTYFFEMTVPAGIQLFYRTENYPNGYMFDSAEGPQAGYDLYFKTYYNDTLGTAVTFNIESPIENQTWATNDITFKGGVTGADSLAIYWGPPSASPANLINGLNIADRQPYSWNFEGQIPNGSYWIWYIATRGTTTVTSTSTITIGNVYTNSADVITSSTMSTTSAMDVLTHYKIDCASSAPTYIFDPTQWWTESAPESLQNGSTTASTTPVLYSVLTEPIYKIIKGPADMANRTSCYLSTANAADKGQALGVMFLYYAAQIGGIDTIFFGSFPMTTIIFIWLIGMIVWFMRKVLPGGK